MIRCCSARVGFRCVRESRCGKLVVRSRYCGYSIGIVEMMFETMSRGDSMSRSVVEVRLGGRGRSSLEKDRV
jgi:hypothetical protein